MSVCLKHFRENLYYFFDVGESLCVCVLLFYHLIVAHFINCTRALSTNVKCTQINRCAHSAYKCAAQMVKISLFIAMACIWVELKLKCGYRITKTLKPFYASSFATHFFLCFSLYCSRKINIHCERLWHFVRSGCNSNSPAWPHL